MDDTRRIIYEARVHYAHKLILLAMLDSGEEADGYAAPLDLLSEMTSLAKRNVQIYLREMRDAGTIIQVRGGRGRGNVAVYRVPMFPEKTIQKTIQKTIIDRLIPVKDDRNTIGGSSFPQGDDRVIHNAPELSTIPGELSPGYPQSYPQASNVRFLHRDGIGGGEAGAKVDLSTSPITSSISNEVTKSNDPPLPPQGVVALSGDAWLANRLEGFRRKYPRPVHLAKRGESGSCVKEAWPEVCTDDEAYARIISGLEKWIESPKWHEEEGRYIPSALTFLEGRYWEKPPTRERNPAGMFDPEQYRRWKGGTR